MSQLAASGSTPEPKQGRCPFLFSLGVSDDAYEHNPHQQQQNHQQPQHLSASSSSSSSSGSLDTAATAAPAAGEGLRRNGSSFASTSSSADTHQSGATSSSHSHPQPAQPSKMHRSPSGTFQAWKQVRDTADSRSVVLSRRQLRRLGRAWTLEEVGRHKAVDDAWIAVNGRVSNILVRLAWCAGGVCGSEWRFLEPTGEHS